MLLLRAVLASVALLLAAATQFAPAYAQESAGGSFSALRFSSSADPLHAVSANALPAGAPASALPAAPEPADWHGRGDHGYEPYATNLYLPPFSRIGIGADVSPLGIGIKGAVILNTDFDARLMGNFFSYETGRFELEGFNVDGKVHLETAAASLDWYPIKSVWRLSAGITLLNHNQFSATGRIASGKNFKLSGITFYGADPGLVPGSTPLTGSGVLGLHTHQPALTLSGGFGRFIPRSERHWSFPSEFGVIFMGAPTINERTAGWVCADALETQCSNLGNASNPVVIKFNNALQTQLTRWRGTLSDVQVYPIFSYSAVYSFDIR